MKKVIGIMLGATLSTPLYAWNGSVDDMNTMNNNMSGPVVRVVRSYPGMFRGWDDNVGFSHTGYVAKKKHIHVRTKTRKGRTHQIRKYRNKHRQASSGVCITQCYCNK